MKNIKTNLAATIVVALMTTTAHAGVFKTSVKRQAKNLYETSSGQTVQTKYCYEYSYHEKAVVKYKKYATDNKIIFESGATCDVDKVLRNK